LAANRNGEMLRLNATRHDDDDELMMMMMHRTTEFGMCTSDEPKLSFLENHISAPKECCEQARREPQRCPGKYSRGPIRGNFFKHFFQNGAF